jgi:sugar O-acyltransferase (sialic acid O-acetyltransferase NeuD family)
VLYKDVKAILLGYSGHGIVVSEAAVLSGIKILGYTGLKEECINPYNFDFLGDENDSNFIWENCHAYILGVGSNAIRERIALQVEKAGGKCLTIVHPNSSLASTVMIGHGTFVARDVAINPLVRIGKNAILNTSCTIDHECIIGDNVHIAPGAVLTGNVIVQDGAFIGANAVVRQGVTIGRNAIVGAGSVVLRNVEANQVVVGNPARIIKRGI